MAELLVKTYDQINSDPYLDVGCDKRGFVITVQEDGYQWGEGEKSSGEFIVLKVPGVPADDFHSLLVPEFSLQQAVPNRMLQIRGFRIDLTAWIANPPRDFVSAMLYKLALPPKPDPNVIGGGKG